MPEERESPFSPRQWWIPVGLVVAVLIGAIIIIAVATQPRHSTVVTPPPPAAPPQEAPAPAPTPTPEPQAGAGPREIVLFIGTRAGGHGIYRIAPDGTGRRLLAATTANLHAGLFSVSRDCRMAYVTTNGDISVMRVDGSQVRRLTNTGQADAPSISPDGRLVVFTQEGSLYRIATDGTGLRRLTTPPAGMADVLPRISPDGRRIAFLRARAQSDSGGATYLMNADGTGERALTRAAVNGAPHWSPNGRYLAVDATVVGEDQGRSFILQPDGRTPMTVADAIHPAFSPDGARLALHNTRSDQPGIGLVRVDGTGRRAIPNTAREETNPTFSPAGDRLAVVEWNAQSEAGTQITLISLDGARRQDLTAGWSPLWVRCR